MNDKEKLKKLFRNSEIDFIESTYGTLKLVQGFKNIDGHYGLYCDLYFDDSGKLLNVHLVDEEQVFQGGCG